MNNFDERASPILGAHDRARLVVLSLTNWTYEQRLQVLQSRSLKCQRAMTEREGRALRREYAQWFADAVAHFNPMIVDGTFARMEHDYYHRRGCQGMPVDRIIDHAQCGRLYDNCGNWTHGILFPELFRTKDPWSALPYRELEPHAWEGMVVRRG